MVVKPLVESTLEHCHSVNHPLPTDLAISKFYQKNTSLSTTVITPGELSVEPDFVPEDGENDEGGVGVATIPTIGSSNRRSPIFPARPPSQPPTPKSAPPHLSLQHRPSEGQQEFIEKLKRKSSLPGTGPPTSTIPPKPGFHLNRRTLTAIPAQSDTDSSQSLKDEGSEVELATPVPANGTGDDAKIIESVAENSEHPTEDTSESLEIQPVFHMNTSPMQRPVPPFRGLHHRDFEPREHFHEHERRNSFHERERRNSFDRRDYDLPPPPRRHPEPYYNDYPGPPPPAFHDSRDPYMRQRPPMKRPLPPPHYDRGGYFPRY